MELKAYDQIPLRVLITNKCNGTCYFCHNEGVSRLYEKNMSMDIFQQIIVAAREQKIKRIVLSGGEPTIVNNINSMLHIVKEFYPDAVLSITTNGVNLQSLLKKDVVFDKLNLSISSFQEQIYSKYQRIDPLPALNMLKDRKMNISVNVVVTKDNYRELEDIISFCVSRNLSIEILFELRSYNKEELVEQISLIRKIEIRYGKFFWKIENVPSLRNDICEKLYISIKHPYFNQYFTWDYCLKCNKQGSCFERICAVRVDEYGNVFPCLNRHINMDGSSIGENIRICYSMLDKGKMIRDLNLPFSLRDVLIQN